MANGSTMKEWIRLSLLICVIGFLKEIRPSEPFITSFLEENKKFSEEEINRDIYPVGTYAWTAQLVLMFLLTDYLRYKPLIILLGICGTVVYCLLIWGTTIPAVQTAEFFYGTYMAAEVAYYTYIYAKVDKKYYPKVTSYARAATLAGKLLGSTISQILVHFKLMNYLELNYITLAAQILTLIWTFLLPNVKVSLYFHRQDGNESVENENDGTAHIVPPRQNRVSHAITLLFAHFKNAYTNPKVLQWSIWYAAGMCGYLQVISYMQVLWNNIKLEDEKLWNGAVDSVSTLLGAGLAIVAGYVHAERCGPHISLFSLVGLSVLEGGALLLMCWAKSLYVSYAGFIIFSVLYAFAITVASAEVARHLEEDSFGLVFGINTFVALCLQTILTVIVVSKDVLDLNVVDQHAVYAFYFICIGLIYLCAGIFDVVIAKYRKLQEAS